MTFLLRVRGKEDAPQLKDRHSLGASQDIALQNIQKRREKTLSEGGVIFVERIPQLDGAFERAHFSRNQLRGANFVEAAPNKMSPNGRFEVVGSIRVGFRRRSAPGVPRHSLDSNSADDFLDQ